MCVSSCFLLRVLPSVRGRKRDSRRAESAGRTGVRSILNTSHPGRRAAHKSSLSLSLSLSASLCLSLTHTHVLYESLSGSLSRSLAHTHSRRRARTLRIRLHFAVVNYGIDLNGECGSVSCVRPFFDGATWRSARQRSSSSHPACL